MNKHDQTNNPGLGTRPDCAMDMDFFVQPDIIFIEVKDRSQQSMTTEEPELAEGPQYENLLLTLVLLLHREEQEPRIEEQEVRIHDLEEQLQGYEQEIYKKDQTLYGASDPLARSTYQRGDDCTGGNRQ